MELGHIQAILGVDPHVKDLAPAGAWSLAQADHGGIALGTALVFSSRIGQLFLVKFLLLVRTKQELATLLQVRLTLGAMIAAVAARACIALRQDMHCPAREEFTSEQRSLAGRVSLILH